MGSLVQSHFRVGARMPKPPEKPKAAGAKAPAKAPPAGKAPPAKGAAPAKGAPTKGAPAAKGAPAGKAGPAKAGGGKGPAKPAVAPANTPTEEPLEEKNLVPCSICGRKFAEDRVATHKEICAKTSSKDVKPFDVRDKRLEGTEAEQFKDVDVDVNIMKGDWKAKHDSMLDAIKEAKKTRPPSAKKDIEVQIVVK